MDTDLPRIPAETVLTRNGVRFDVVVMVERNSIRGPYTAEDFYVNLMAVSGEILSDAERLFVAESIAESMNNESTYSDDEYRSALADEAADAVWDS